MNMGIHVKSVDMDTTVKFHIHGNAALRADMRTGNLRTAPHYTDDSVTGRALACSSRRPRSR